MAGNGFKYIIQAEVQLNMSSVNKLINQVALIDRQIQDRAIINVNAKVSNNAKQALQREIGAIKVTIPVRLGLEKGSLATLKRDVDIVIGNFKREVETAQGAINEAQAGQPNNGNGRGRNPSSGQSRAYRSDATPPRPSAVMSDGEINTQKVLNAKLNAETKNRAQTLREANEVDKEHIKATRKIISSLQTGAAEDKREAAMYYKNRARDSAEITRLRLSNYKDRPSMSAYQKVLNNPMATPASKNAVIQKMQTELQRIAIETGKTLSKSISMMVQTSQGAIRVNLGTTKVDENGQIIKRISGNSGQSAYKTQKNKIQEQINKDHEAAIKHDGLIPIKAKRKAKQKQDRMFDTAERLDRSHEVKRDNQHYRALIKNHMLDRKAKQKVIDDEKKLWDGLEKEDRKVSARKDTTTKRAWLQNYLFDLKEKKKAVAKENKDWDGAHREDGLRVVKARRKAVAKMDTLHGRAFDQDRRITVGKIKAKVETEGNAYKEDGIRSWKARAKSRTLNIRQYDNAITEDRRREAQRDELHRKAVIQNLLMDKNKTSQFEKTLMNPDASILDKQNAYAQLKTHNSELAKAMNEPIRRGYTVQTRDANGGIAKSSIPIKEWDQFGNEVDKANKSISQMMTSLTRHMAFHTTIVAGFYKITEAIVSSVAIMKEFEAQFTQIDILTKARSTNVDGTINPNSGFSAKKSESDVFELSKRYGRDPVKEVLPFYTEILRQHDLAPNGDVAKQLTQIVLKGGLAAKGASGANSEVFNAMGHDVLTVARMMSHTWKDEKKDPVRELNGFMNDLAAMNNKGAHADKILDAMGEELVPFSNGEQGRIPLRKLAAFVGSSELALGADGKETAQAVKLMLTNLSKPRGSGPMLAAQILGYSNSPDTTLEKKLDALAKGESLDGRKLTEGERKSIALDLASSGGGGGSASASKISAIMDGMKTNYGNLQNLGNTDGEAERQAKIAQSTLTGELGQLNASFQQLAVTLGKAGILDALKGMVKVLTQMTDVATSVIGVLAGINGKMHGILGDHVGTAVNMAVAGGVAVKIGAVIKDKLFNGSKSILQEGSGATTLLENILFGGKGTAKALPVVPAVAAAENVAGRAVSTGVATSVAASVASSIPLGPVASKKDQKLINAYFDALSLEDAFLAQQHTNPSKNRLKSWNKQKEKTYKASSALEDRGYNVFDIAGLASMLPSGTVQKGVPTKAVKTVVQVGEEVAKKSASSKVVSVGSAIGGGALNLLGLKGLLGRGAAAQGGKTAVTGIVEGFIKLLPVIGRFGMLLTRLSLWGAIIGGVVLGISKLYSMNQTRLDKAANATTAKLDANPSQVTSGLLNGFDEIRAMSSDKSTLNDLGKYNNMYKKQQELRKQFGDGVSYYDNYMKIGLKGPTGDRVDYKINYDDAGRQQLVDALEAKKAGMTTTDLNIQKPNRQFLNQNAMMGDIKQTSDLFDKRMAYADLSDKVNNIKFTGATDSAAYYKSSMDTIDNTVGGMQDGFKKLISQRQLLASQSSENTGTVNAFALTNNKEYQGIAQDFAMNAGKGESGLSETLTKYTSEANKNKGDQAALLNAQIAQAVYNQERDKVNTADLEDKHKKMVEGLTSEIQKYKELSAAYMLAASGANVIEAALKKVDVSLNEARTSMALTTTEQGKIGASAKVYGVMAQQASLYAQEISGMQGIMDSIKASNPSEDFSLAALNNPSEKGLSKAQNDFKTVDSAQQQAKINYSQSIDSLRQQADAMVDLVMNTDKYKSIWESVNNRIELSKNLYGQLRDMQVSAQMAPVMQGMHQKLFGEAFDSGAFAKQGAEQRRDAYVGQFEQIAKALYTYGDDANKLNQAMAQIQGDLGGQFKAGLIDPFKNIIDTSLATAAQKQLTASTTFAESVGILEQLLKAEMAKAQIKSPNSVDEPIVDNKVSRNAAIKVAEDDTDNTSARKAHADLYNAKKAEKIAGGNYEDVIAKASSQYGVDPALIKAVIQQESSFNQIDPKTGKTLTSPAGALGLMQLMPGTAAGLKVDANDPEQNIMGGTKYLAGLLQQFGGDVSKALIGYNAGPGNVDNVMNSANGEWKEPKDYVNKVTGYYSQFGGDPTKVGNKAIETKNLNDNAQAKLAARQLQEKLLDGMLSEQVSSLGANSIQYNLNRGIRDANTKSSISGMWTDSQTGYYDSVTQARQDVATAKYGNDSTLKQYKDDLAGGTYYNPATKQQEQLTEGMKASYERNIAKLEENSKALSDLGNTLKQSSYWDPRDNTTEANKQIDNVIASINSMVGTSAVGDKKWYDDIQSLNSMLANYFTLDKKVQVSQQAFDGKGVGYENLAKLKQLKFDQDVSLLFTQMNAVAGVLGKFAEGTNKWFTVLEDAVNLQQKLVDMENKKTELSKKYFELTNKGIYAYVNSRAYTQSRDTSNAYTNKNTAIANYQAKRGNQDQNEQLVNLQIISESHDKVIQQMNDYRNAVVGAFQAGAISLQEYVQRLDGLRDKQDEIKKQAVEMTSTMQSGFQSSLSGALKNGLQGSFTAPLDFVQGIKDQLASSVSNQMSTVMLQQSGLQNVMNNLITSMVGSMTSSDPNASVNAFNTNDFKKQIDAALNPFLPLIEQISQSAKGIFGILKDQTFNAPSGFKIDDYLYEVSKAQSGNAVGGWMQTNPVNEAGSPYPLSSGNTIVLPPAIPSPYQYNPSIVTKPIDPIGSGSMASPFVTKTRNPVKEAIQKVIDLKSNFDMSTGVDGSTTNIATHSLADDVRKALGELKDGNGNDIVSKIGDGIKDSLNIDDLKKYLQNTDLSKYDITTGINGVAINVNDLANVAASKLDGVIGGLSNVQAAILARAAGIVPPVVGGGGGGSTGTPIEQQGGKYNTPINSPAYQQYQVPSAWGNKDTYNPAPVTQADWDPNYSSSNSSSSSSSYASGYSQVSAAAQTQSVISQMMQNSSQWSSSNSDFQNQNLHDTNASLAASIGATYNASEGAYYKDGKPLYHTGGIAGISHFSSAKSLKNNEINAIMQHGEVALQPKQISSLVQSFTNDGGWLGTRGGGGWGRIGTPEDNINTPFNRQHPNYSDLITSYPNNGNTGVNGGWNPNAASSGDSNINVQVDANIGGDIVELLKDAIQTAVSQAVSQVYRNTRLDSLRTTGTWKG